MTRMRSALVVLLTLVLGACLTESRGFLSFNFDDPCLYGLQPNCPPITTQLGVLTIGGQIVRAPPSQELELRAIAVVGTDTVVATADLAGFFDLSIALVRDDTNEVVLTADDGFGATSERARFLVIVTEDVPGLASTPDR